MTAHIVSHIVHNRVWVKIDQKIYLFIGRKFLCSLNEEKCLKFCENQKKKVLTIHNAMYCILNF